MKLNIKYLHQFLLIFAMASIIGLQAQSTHLKINKAAEIEYTNFKYIEPLTVYVKGTVMDSISRLRLDGVTIEIREGDGVDNFHFVTSNSGNFGSNWKKNGLLDVLLIKPGYMPFKTSVRTEQIRNHFLLAFLQPDSEVKSLESNVIRNIPVQLNRTPTFINKNALLFEEELSHLMDSLHAVVIKRYSLYYEPGSSLISSSAKVVAHSIVNSTKNQRDITVLVAGFTDCCGDSIVNIQLAKKRAGSVRKVLQKLGVSTVRINTAYFGKKHFVLPCIEGHKYDRDKQQVHRRSEVLLIQPVEKVAYLPGKVPVPLEVKAKAMISESVPVHLQEKAKAIVSEKPPIQLQVKTKAIVSEQAVLSTPIKLTISDSIKTVAAVSANAESNIKAEKSLNDKPIYKNDLKTDPIKNNRETIYPPKGDNDHKADFDLKQDVSNSAIDSFTNKIISISRSDSLVIVARREADLVIEMSKRISKTPILLHTNSDSMHIEMYDNGVFDYDTISVIYNGKLRIMKQLLQVNKAISFYVKVDDDERKNELIFFADNLGLIPPNSALMIITDKEGKRTEVSVTNDLGHNAVIYFIKPKKKTDS